MGISEIDFGAEGTLMLDSESRTPGYCPALKTYDQNKKAPKTPKFNITVAVAKSPPLRAALIYQMGITGLPTL